VFLRNPEALSYYINQNWTNVDKVHVPNTEDMTLHIGEGNAALVRQIVELRQEIAIELDGIREIIQVLQSQTASLQQHVVDNVTQIGNLQNQVTTLQTRITALEAKVNEDESQQTGLWAHVESILTWINTAGAILSRIEAVLVAAGLL
jgi:chromosome segregation ATPase